MYCVIYLGVCYTMNLLKVVTQILFIQEDCWYVNSFEPINLNSLHREEKKHSKKKYNIKSWMS